MVLGELPPEINHIFAEPEPRPNKILSAAFSGIIVFIFLYFSTQVSMLKLNSGGLKSAGVQTSILFISIISIIGLYFWFWYAGNIIDTIKILLVLLIVPIIANSLFQSNKVATDKQGKEKKGK
ncbi:unnamed protein product [Blepharisma stoltei]|uniref:Ribophorin II C-terminal domain-containing protein n=1 Tax=Blepharisma stoltei TaxID=1481888 RepID=A0AAU9JMR2_9CILI|nr:unnamed protein product [Blepharisma stoltei]